MSRLSALLAFAALSGCSVAATRPVQLMSDTSAAIRAAREVQADSLAPELFRQASEWYAKAKREYKFKNFKDANDFARKARRYAEQAEVEAIQAGAKRTEALGEPMAPEGGPPPPPVREAYAYPTPTGTPADVYDERRKEEQQLKAPPTNVREPAPLPTPSPL